MAAPAMKLYEHTEAIQLVEEWINENEDAIREAGGALPDELVELLDAAQMGFKEKAEAVALVVMGLVRSERAVLEEVGRLNQRAAHFARSAKGLKDYLRLQLGAIGEKKIETPRVTMWRQLAAPSVKLNVTVSLEEKATDPAWALFIVEETIPARTEYTLDKTRVVERWKELEALRLAAEAANCEDPENGALPAGLTVERTEFLRIN